MAVVNDSRVAAYRQDHGMNLMAWSESWRHLTPFNIRQGRIQGG